MKKSKWAIVATGLVGCATIGGAFYNSPLKTQAATALHLIQYKPSSVTQHVSKSVKTSSTDTNHLVKSSSTDTNPLQLDTSGPIEHYVWKHQGLTDNVWQNTESGYWRIEKTFLDGSSQKDIYKNGYLYLMAYDANGKLQDTEKIHQSASYTGKDDAFNGLKVDKSSFTNIGDSTVSNVPVKVLQRDEHRFSNATESTKLYIDTIHGLPLKEEHIINGMLTSTDTWNYSYIQNDDSLFAIPTNISFKDAPTADSPVVNK